MISSLCHRYTSIIVIITSFLIIQRSRLYIYDLTCSDTCSSFSAASKISSFHKLLSYKLYTLATPRAERDTHTRFLRLSEVYQRATIEPTRKCSAEVCMLHVGTYTASAAAIYTYIYMVHDASIAGSIPRLQL